IAGPSRAHCRSLPTPSAISPSAVRNVSYGTMLVWALPRRIGARPVTRALWAWMTSTARVLWSSDTSIRWPFDASSRDPGSAAAPAPLTRRGTLPRPRLGAPAAAPGLSCEQPGKDGRRTEQAADHVADRDADLRRPA